MSKEKNKNEENNTQNIVFEGTRKFMLAGLGAIMMAQDELGNLANKLVEQGEITEEKSRERVNEFISDQKKKRKKATKQIETDFNKQMGNILNRMNIPTRSEIKTLNNKITRLTKKVDELGQS